MKDIKIVYQKTGLNFRKDIQDFEMMIEEKVNNGYKIISSNMSIANNIWIYAIMEKEL